MTILQNANVLLVDDEIHFVEAIARRLSKRGLKIHEAHSGVEALEVLREVPEMDVVVLDVKMPGLDGLETLKAIKSEYPVLEVVMLTGHATVESAIDGMKLGAFDYLMKPCEIEILMEKISQAKARHDDQMERITQARLRDITRTKV
ncbi:response regulator [Maridesulfovibrio bastinii]|uniref:response regulator n=1 Tax=Maridesulfovibrio bastinii TaxID=47157 RepID=UPI000403A56E|nr:response regulator [Maridesulfovibrio bastinii]